MALVGTPNWRKATMRGSAVAPWQLVADEDEDAFDGFDPDLDEDEEFDDEDELDLDDEDLDEDEDDEFDDDEDEIDDDLIDLDDEYDDLDEDDKHHAGPFDE